MREKLIRDKIELDEEFGDQQFRARITHGNQAQRTRWFHEQGSDQPQTYSVMITADQLLAHAIGDYIIQSDWMATEKTKRSLAAGIHAISYAVPFLFLTQSILALVAIVSTHFVIDRWRLARYVIWAKNRIMTRKMRSWRECSATGFDPDRPAWLAVWLLIITDNIIHVVINGAAIRWL